MKQILWIALSCLFLLTTAHAASFDCAKSTSNTELLICGNTALSKLDDDLDKSYRQALASSKDKPSLTNAQRKWLRDVRNACLNVDCLKSVYKLRISELLTRSPKQESKEPRSANQEKLVAFNVGMPGVCGFPGVNFSEDTVVLAAGGLGGRLLDFQLDQSGHMATQIDVAVNYPDKPVALMLGASEPTIWNIGWTEGTNIVAVFASGYYSQRVAGLKANTPSLVSSSEDKGPCNTPEITYSKLGLHDGYVASFEFGNNTNIGSAATEQKLSKILYARRISRIFSVPDGKGAVVIGEPLSPGQQLVTSDATPPNSFQDKNAPLAGEAGLSMAMKKGILRRANLKDAEKWIEALKRKYALQHLPPPDIPPDLDNAYVVLKKFVYPPGLDSTGVSFYIPEGVPLPTGEYGSARVYDLNSITLECATSSPCGQAISRGKIGAGSTFVKVFGDSVDKIILDSAHGGRLTGPVVDGKAETISEGIRPLAGWGASGAIQNSSGSRPAITRAEDTATNLSYTPFAKGASAPSQTELHAIGVYEGPRHFGGMPAEDPSSSTITVRVHAKRSPVVLALYNYESVLWNIIADEGVVIKEIILSSYHASKVSGIDEKVVKVTRQNIGIVHDNSTAKSAAPKLMAYTGLDVGTFQTSYKGTEFSVGP